MTVKELIDALSEYPKDMKVGIDYMYGAGGDEDSVAALRKGYDLDDNEMICVSNFKHLNEK